MPTFTPVDDDPFAAPAAPARVPVAPRALRLVPVDEDPFAQPAGAPAAQPGAPSPLLVRGSPQNAGDALDMVEGTGRDAYATAPDPNATPPSQRFREMGQMAVSALDAAANAVPFTDRLAALAAAGTGIGGKFGDYSGNLAQLRKEEGDAMAAQPGAALVGGLVGGAALPVPALGPVASAATLGGKVVRGALAGGAIGALQGAGASADFTDAGQTARDAGIGAGLGALAGGALPPVAGAYGIGMRLLRGDPVASMAGVSPAARDAMLAAIAKDGPEAVARNAALYGPEAMLFDYGPGLKGVAQGLATKDGPAAAVVGDALGARQAATNARVRAGLDQNFGAAQDPAAVKAAIGEVGQAAAEPYFARAAQAGVPYPAELAQRPAVASALRDAAADAANRGRPFPTVTLDAAGNQVGPQAALDAANAATRPAVDRAVGALLGDGGGTIGTAEDLLRQRAAIASPLYAQARAAVIPDDAMPIGLLGRLQQAGAFDDARRTLAIQGRPLDIGNIEPWDLMKRSLDDRIGAAQRSGENHAASVYQGLKGELTGALDAAVPSYAQARQAFAGQSDLMAALRQGQQASGTATTREQVARDFAGLGTDGERQMYRLGLGNAYREGLSRAGDGADFATRVAGNQQVRDKLASVAPSQAALNAFNGHMAQARQTFTEAQRPTGEAWQRVVDTLDARAAKGDAGAAAARDALVVHLQSSPDYARARGVQQDYAGLRDAVDYGRNSLAAGGDPVWPSAYAAQIAGMSPAGVAANQVGQRAAMEEAVGLAPNDQLAIKRLFGVGNTPGFTAPGVVPGAPDLSSFNAEKLATSFGHEPVARMQELLNANDAFNDTFNGVLRNSATARREAMVAALKDADWKPRDVMDARSDHATALGLVKQGVAKVVNAAGHALQGAPSTAVRDVDLARLGTLTGAPRMAAVSELLDRLPAYTGRETAAEESRRQAMLLASLLAGGGSQVAVDRPSAPASVLARALRGGAQR